jgi:phage tail-like protein
MFKSVVKIDNVAYASFQKCSGPLVEMAKIEHYGGGSLVANKSLGRLSFSDVTVDRGATQGRDLFDWLQEVVIVSSGLGLVDPYYKRRLDIVQQGRDGATLPRWFLARAWPTKFVASEWENDTDENLVESVTLTFAFFELLQ